MHDRAPVVELRDTHPESAPDGGRARAVVVSVEADVPVWKRVGVLAKSEIESLFVSLPLGRRDFRSDPLAEPFPVDALPFAEGVVALEMPMEPVEGLRPGKRGEVRRRRG